MTRDESVIEAYFLATGKSVSAVTSIPTAKRNLLTSLAIKYYRKWQTEPGMEWNSLYSVVSAGTVTATDTFTLASAIHFLATQEQHERNTVRVLHADGVNYTDYTVVKPSELHINRNNNAVAKISATQIKFSKPFKTTDQQFGGTIQAPAIKKLADLTDGTSTVLIDQESWLPERMSAQYCLSYKSLRVLYPDRLDEANETMKAMKAAQTTGNETSSTGVDYFATMGNVG